MAIQFHPHPGTLLVCDFAGFKTPDMIKIRPVVVVSLRARHGANLCTIVPLSTTPPNPARDWHYKLSLTEPLAPKWPETEMWAKCDMLYTFGYERLDRFHRRVEDKRKYYDKRVSDAELAEIRQCIRRFIHY